MWLLRRGWRIFSEKRAHLLLTFARKLSRAPQDFLGSAEKEQEPRSYLFGVRQGVPTRFGTDIHSSIFHPYGENKSTR
jgi:hypothetical protein